MKIKVQFGSKSNVLEVSSTAVLRDVNKEVADLFHLDVHRVSLKYTAEKSGEKVEVRLADHCKTLQDYEIPDQAQLELKDLGLQFSYTGVFFWEYFGPILLSFIFYFRPALLYGTASSEAMSWTARASLIAFVLHYVKRELETFIIHKFSHDTMPIGNLIRNSIYYWTFAGLILYPLCHPQYTPPSLNQTIMSLMGMFVCELINFLVHFKFGRGRKDGHGSTERIRPDGLLFMFTLCPNYTAEVFSWICFSLATNIAASWVFMLVGLIQMTEWALKKKAGYVKIDQKYKRKPSILPFLI